MSASGQKLINCQQQALLEVDHLPAARHKSVRTRTMCEGNDISSQLKGFSLFKECTACFLEAMSANLEMKNFEQGSEIIKQGDIGDRMYLLRYGEVDVTVGNHKVAVLQSGVMFGEMACLSTHSLATKRTASILARTVCLCYTIDRPHLLQVLAAFPRDSAILFEVADQRMKALLDKGLVCTEENTRTWQPEHRTPSKESQSAGQQRWNKLRCSLSKDSARKTSQTDEGKVLGQDGILKVVGALRPSLLGKVLRLRDAESDSSAPLGHSDATQNAIRELLLSNGSMCKLAEKNASRESWSVGESASVREARHGALEFLEKRGLSKSSTCTPPT